MDPITQVTKMLLDADDAKTAHRLARDLIHVGIMVALREKVKPEIVANYARTVPITAFMN